MNKFHKTLAAARSNLAQLDVQIQTAKETADRLREYRAQRTEIVGSAYLQGETPDVVGIDALILSAEGAAAAIAVLTGLRPEKVEQVTKAESDLNAAITDQVIDRFNACVLVYQDALDNLRGALVEMQATANAMPGDTGRQLQAAVSFVHEPVSNLLRLYPERGWAVYSKLSTFGIADDVKSRLAEINAELAGN